ncbi:MAG: hypothetical protein K6T57_15665 [Thermaceae bacterium]|nr:hypothetical protein [Thermaceae bacterium]
MLASFAQKIWSFLQGLFGGLGNAITGAISSALSWLQQAFGSLMSFLGGLFHSLLQGIGTLLQGLLNGIASVLRQIFSPIFAIVDAFFYFVSRLAQLLGLLVQLLIQVVHVLLAFAWGLLRTLIGLVWDQSTPQLPGSVSSPLSHMGQALGLLQLDKLADLLLFAVWILTAIAVIRIISSFSQGGGGE